MIYCGVTTRNAWQGSKCTTKGKKKCCRHGRSEMHTKYETIFYYCNYYVIIATKKYYSLLIFPSCLSILRLKSLHKKGLKLRAISHRIFTILTVAKGKLLCRSQDSPLNKLGIIVRYKTIINLR